MRYRIALALVAMLTVLVACGDDTASTTTSDEPIVFGEGEIPDSVPDAFPIPPNARVGSTLVDRVNNRTEFRLVVPTDSETTVRFFQVGLVNQGYVIDSSTGTAVQWAMTFSSGEMEGTIVVTPSGEFSNAVVSLSAS
jgi:hypothetical protein